MSARTKYGRLTILSLLPPMGGGTKALCRCDCGAEGVFNVRNMMSGNTLSCGCLKRELDLIRRKTHGMSKTPEYETWCHIKKRCLNPDDQDFKDYGGRGITICDRWRDSFEAFLSDVGRRPDGYSIERENVDGNYEPGNVCWIPKSKQNLNKRTTHWVEFQGKQIPLTVFCRLSSAVSSHAVKSRIYAGWEPQKALTVGPLSGHGTLEQRRTLGIEQ